jgi:ketosteroid isomerase-like protein
MTVIFLQGPHLFSQSREAGTDFSEIKKYMNKKEETTATPKSIYTDAIKLVLKQYNSAIEKKDLSGTESLFTNDSQIFESGESKGTYARYKEDYLLPKLAGLKSEWFSDYSVNITVTGKYAFATESYNYFNTGKDEVQSSGKCINTFVLKRTNGQWKILTYHNSSKDNSN